MKKIDINNWERKEYFQHYHDDVPCTYSMTFKLNISNIIKKQYKIYPAMIYAIITVANQFEEFRTNFNDKQELVVFDSVSPYYTILNQETNTFTCVHSEICENLENFIKQYQNDVKQYGNSKQMQAQQNIPDNVINISMIPWVSFEGFNLNLPKSKDYLLPIFTMGKYYNEQDNIIIPMAIQVHHAVCDGYHLGQYIKSLQAMIDAL